MIIQSKNILLQSFAVMLSILVLASCRPTRYISENESLYTGADLDMGDSFYEDLSLKSDLNNVIIPDPNRKVLGVFPMRMWFYHIAGDSVPEKGLRHWLKYRIGEEPVIYQTYMAERSKSNLQYELKRQGYFDARTSFDPVTKHKKTAVTYKVQTGNRYKINNVTFPDTINGITRRISESQNNTVLKKGEFYDLDMLKEERERIGTFLNNRGYYAFIPDYIGFKLDSSRTSHTIDLMMYLKASMPEKATRVYSLGDVYVIENANEEKRPDTINMKRIHYVSEEYTLKPNVLKRSILFNPGDQFRLNRHNATIKKLVGLDVYKYINIDYKEDSTSGSPVLIPEIKLTPDIPKTVDLTLEAVTKSNDQSGPGLSLSYNDRNFLHRAQKLNIGLNAGFETQLFSKKQGVNSINLSLESSLEIPKLVFPFLDLNKLLADKYRSSTSFTLDNSFLRREQYFSMYSLNAGWAYNWQETAEKHHSLKIFSLDYADIYKQSEAFINLNKKDPLVAQSYAEQFILSWQYTFTYRNQDFTDKRLSSYFSGNLETAGNVLNWIDGKSGTRNKFLGVYFAQYVRTTLDTRFYYDLKKYGSLAYRFYAGVGYAYNNSNVLPYSKQFFSGGANSLRGFRYNSIGPGSYRDTSLNNVLYYQPGDIKLETNLEYRFPIAGFFKGALFMDAGNIWLLRENAYKPGSLFKPDNILSQLAVNTGLGLRLDASIIILRLDIGLPLRDPSLPAGERWLTRSSNMSSWNWYRNNLVFNIALGYPF
ncbi:BamA/TamA family outer membrane protein [Saccharicrinis sp. FJH54]|uniref:translocation and assembly module lipoprotein TamL n=1 Tax=Saccharicrinis sp. FJH54 TaxID=3344665 RepID=UPI0035D47D72